MPLARFILDNSLLLVAGTIGALLWANGSPESYQHFTHGQTHFLVNDVLMCLFFGLAAKEIWEALLPGGALSSPKKAATPLLATLGGVIGPVGIYVVGATVFGHVALMRGWAVPTATDIAFSFLVARIIFGARHPAIPFLLLLAIADDALGLVILGIFYPQGDMHLLTFAVSVISAIAFNQFVLKKWLKVQNFWPYVLLAGPLSWYGFHEGGIHPALALVPLIPTLPHATKDEGVFAERQLPKEKRKRDALNEFEHFFKYPVEVVLMLFGLVNAGVVFSDFGFATSLVGVALLLGKPVGIALSTFLGVKLFHLDLPTGMGMKDVLVLGTTAGIGFTVALFVCGVAFPPGAALEAAKIGALSSFAAAGLAFMAARILGVKRITEVVEKTVESIAPLKDAVETAVSIPPLKKVGEVLDEAVSSLAPLQAPDIEPTKHASTIPPPAE